MRWQEHLGQVIRNIFPGKNVLTNVRKNAHIVHAPSGRFLELDFWIPDIKLAFEYQDPHHYVSTWYSNVSAKTVQGHDDLKKSALDIRGETLVSVPCWWDGNEDSLIATICLTRPELFPEWSAQTEPISPIPPTGFFYENEVRGIGQLMLASFAHSASEDQDFQSWWISEKYDGVRVAWNSDDSALYSRYGKPISFPRVLEKLFPDQFIDGEIWFGRGSFHQALRYFEGNEEVSASELRILAFDCPKNSLQDSNYEDRYKELIKAIPDYHPFLITATCHSCRSTKHAKRVTKMLLASGSEGSIVRAPKSTYQQGRSENLIKFKAHRDREALVLGLNSDDTYTLRFSDDSLCVAPLASEWALEFTPKSGDIVTLVYSGFMPSGAPKLPRISDLRGDLTWIDVLTGADYSQSATMVTQKALAQVQPRQQQGFWNSDENVRAFCDEFAKRHNFDPLLASSWYSASRAEFIREGGHSVLNHFNGSFINVLIDTYPEVYFDETKFANSKKSYWVDKNTRREFLIKFAQRMNFDPLEPSNWYSISQKSVVQNESKISSLFSFYNNSYATALMDLFPEIGIDPTKFTKIKQGYWNNEKHRRAFFDAFAAKRKLDPLDPETWYPIEKRHIMTEKGWRQMLGHYKDSVQTAVMTLYPEIGLDATKFHSRSIRGFWDGEDNVRKFFDALAGKLGFDPLEAQNWYDFVNKDIITKEKGGHTIITKYATYSTAIAAAYPSLYIDASKFNFKPPPTEEERREFFEKFANKHGFDPHVAKNWYRFKSRQIIKEQGGTKILSYYDNSLIRALQQLFPEIGVDPYLFTSCRVHPTHWKARENVKQFFEKVAKQMEFDPSRNLEPWYQVKRYDITKLKGGSTILSYFEGSHVSALMSVYPDLDPNKFKFANVDHYHTPAHRRAFFDRIANSKGFDPLIASNWVEVSRRELIAKKGGSAILSSFDGSLISALKSTYPNF